MSLQYWHWHHPTYLMLWGPAFLTNPKYSQVPGTKDDIGERLQGQEAVVDNIEAALIMLRQGTDVMQGCMSQDVRE